MFKIGITDHVEGPADQSAGLVFDQASDLVRLADQLGVTYAWFAEHHIHIHQGHLPAPLLLALHLCGQTKNIHLGTAIICLNLHHPLAVAEQVATADILSGNRLAVGFGSGSTPEEFTLFGLRETNDEQRHQLFEQSLKTILAAWVGQTPNPLLPIPSPHLASRCWVAVNSVASAKIAGRFNFNMLFSHLRTPAQYLEYRAAYHAAGGSRLIAANRPVFVAADDATAWAMAEPALRMLWRRFQSEGKIPASLPEPNSPQQLCDHPINFIVGGPKSVARQLLDLHAQIPFDVANLELRWAGLSHELTRDSLKRLMNDVMPLIK